MSTEENKKIIYDWYEDFFNQKNLAAFEAYNAPHFVTHSLPPGVDVKESLAMQLTAFPDLHITVDDMIAEGNQIVCRYTARGTHLGPFLDIPATGKPFVITGIDIHRFENGKIVEHWDNVDFLSLFQQVGILPSVGL